MTRQTFIDHFKLALIHLKDLTSRLCFNELSDNYVFILEPNEYSTGDHLTKAENDHIKTWNKLQNKQLSFEQVTELFYQHNKTPKWIDCNVYHSTPHLTVVCLYFSHEFKDESEIYYMERGTGPFKAVVVTPDLLPDFKVTPGDKFDVNWKKYLNDKNERPKRYL